MVEIIVVGNEILLGSVLDTNSNYLCRVVRGMGGRVRHIAVVADQTDQIAAELQRSIGLETGLIITCGGLGPTEDDLTLAAVAKATGRSLLVDEAAREFVANRYKMLAADGFVADPEMSESRLKMARLPEGAQMIHNPVGTAPAAILRLGSSQIVSLPGVPAELKGIVEGPLQTVLSELLGGSSYSEKEILVRCGDESVLAPILQTVAKRHPAVYIKSRASGFGREEVFRLLLSTTGRSVVETESALREASQDLLNTFFGAGIAVAP